MKIVFSCGIRFALDGIPIECILQCKINGKIFSNDYFLYLLKSIKLYKKDKVEIYI